MKIIHYDHGRGYIMPISGRHTICLCGQDFQDNYKLDRKRKTTDRGNVTCKNCIKKIDKIKIEMGES